VVRFKCPQCQAMCQADETSDRSATCESCGHTIRMAQPAANSSASPTLLAPRRNAEPARAERSDRFIEDGEEAEDSPSRGPRRSGDARENATNMATTVLGYGPIVIRILALVRIMIWGICAIVVLASLSSYSHAYARASSAIQEASVAADACVGLIATYVLTRVFHSCTLAVETIFRPKP
jgi:hypothetical protein